MLAYALAKQSSDGGNLDGMQLLLALCDHDRALALKRIMAEQFEDMEGSVQALGGPLGSTLIQERNKVALSVLRKQLAAGKQRIAIFYGAGHLGDFDQRLREDFDLTPSRPDGWRVGHEGRPQRRTRNRRRRTEKPRSRRLTINLIHVRSRRRIAPDSVAQAFMPGITAASQYNARFPRSAAYGGGWGKRAIRERAIVSRHKCLGYGKGNKTGSYFDQSSLERDERGNQWRAQRATRACGETLPGVAAVAVATPLPRELASEDATTVAPTALRWAIPRPEVQRRCSSRT